MDDIANYILMKDNLKINDEEFRHKYNPAHVYCRLVDKYNIDKDLAYQYILDKYDKVYKRSQCECKNE